MLYLTTCLYCRLYISGQTGSAWPLLQWWEMSCGLWYAESSVSINDLILLQASGLGLNLDAEQPL